METRWRSATKTAATSRVPPFSPPHIAEKHIGIISCLPHNCLIPQRMGHLRSNTFFGGR